MKKLEFKLSNEAYQLYTESTCLFLGSLLTLDDAEIPMGLFLTQGKAYNFVQNDTLFMGRAFRGHVHVFSVPKNHFVTREVAQKEA